MVVLTAFLFGVPPLGGLAQAATTNKPNIVFILADDLGYGDLGCFGQKKIRTPNLDRMAAEGARLTQHYSGNAVCAPSRCVLMTGKHPGHAYIRNNKEVQPEGNEPIPAATVTLAKLLKKNGYATAAVGKWGLGPPDSEGDPLKQGFDKFFGYKCQRHAHNHYPTYLWDNDQRVALKNRKFSAQAKLPFTADASAPESYREFAGTDYAPDLFRQHALEFVRKNSGKPFFLYYATTVPHLALQVPEDSVAEYRGQWPDQPYTGDKRYLPHLSPRAAYAAMVTRMDRDIGDVMKLVSELGLDDNTIFVFSSDNGPLYNKHGGTDAEFFESAGPLRGRKGSLYEGGIRVPTIVRWKGKIAAGQIIDRVTGFEDWLPTLLELLEASAIQPADIDGISFAPTLLGKSQPPRPFLYREFPASGGWQSVRMGDWKGVRTNLNATGRAARSKDSSAIALYNLKDDIGEKRDLARDHPEVVAQIQRIMDQQHQRSELFPIAALDGVKKQE